MAKVKIVKKELIWDVFNIEDDSKISIVENSAYCLDKKILKKMYSTIVSVYDGYTYEQFCEEAKYFIASVGEYDFCDYYSVKELKAYHAFSPKDVFFYAVARNKWNMIEIEADYFSIQDTDDYDRPFTKATYQDYDSAIKYCRENNVDINNIVPQKWGTYEFLLG
jgi:hypothetical protein